MSDIPLKLTGDFSFSGISIMKDKENDCFLVLICNTNMIKEHIYGLLLKSKPVVKTFIDPITKVYSFVLEFVYSAKEKLEYRYNTLMTSKEYPPLIWLNNCTVQFITTGMEVANKKNAYSYGMPLIPVTCVNIN